MITFDWKPGAKIAAFSAIFLLICVSRVSAETIKIDPPADPIQYGSPVLQLERSVASPRVNVPGVITVTDTIRNSGTQAAENVVLSEAFPPGMTAENEKDLKVQFGSLKAGTQKTHVTTIAVGNTALPGRYSLDATLAASNSESIEASAVVDVTKPAVLGAETLAETGSGSFWMFLVGLLLLSLGSAVWPWKIKTAERG